MPWYRAPTPRRFHLERLFRPTAIAIVGSDTPDGALILRNLRASGFNRPVFPVPSTDPRGGTAVPDIASLPSAPDLAIVATAPEQVAGTLVALSRVGCTAAVVTAPAPGVAQAARASGVRVLGPGSFGIAVPALGLNATKSHLPVPAGSAALVSQSAALCRAVLDWAEPNGLGFSHIVGIGENADIGFGMAMDWLSREPGTSVILLDIHSISDRRSFLSAARAAARLCPVLAIRPGTRLGDPSGEAEAVCEAALRRAGIIAVGTLEHLLAGAETLTRARPARGECLAIVANSVGPGEIAADAALRSGIALAELPAEARAALEGALPARGVGAAGPSTGPLHIALDGPTRLAEAAAMLSAVPEIGGILIVHTPEGESDAVAVEAILACVHSAKLPVLVALLGETTGAAHRRRLAEAGVAVFPGSEQGVRGFLRLVQQQRNRAAARELPPSNVLELTPDRELVRRLFAQARGRSASDANAGRRAVLTQDETFQVLSAYGVPCVPTRFARTPDEAAIAAAELGFPVVLKLPRGENGTPALDSDDGAGPLALGLFDEGSVAGAARVLAFRSPRAAERGFIVQRQVGRARELLIRVADDAMFGPAIGFGQGGSAAHLLNDFAFDLPPLNLPLARALVARTRVARTLGKFRDQPAANTAAIAATLVRISQLIVDFPEIAELEVNPLFVNADGAQVANAWMALRPAGEAAPLAIAPYPAELCCACQTDGERLTIRPIRPEDAEAHRAFFARLPAEDIRFRFFSPLRELSPERTARMTQIDYGREMALIAEREADHATVGVARLAREEDEDTAEFAIIVQPDVKGKGVATELMSRLIEWARSQGIREIVGQVLADNAPMLAFARRLGFTAHHLPGEEGVLEVRLALR